MIHGKATGGILFGSINVNGIDASSGIFIGKNEQGNRDSGDKANSGLGTVSGKMNLIGSPVTIIMDNDHVDSTIKPSDADSKYSE